MSNRQAFEAMIYLLRTGIQWNALPREAGASSTVLDRLQEWEQAGFFKALWQAGGSRVRRTGWHRVGVAGSGWSDAASAPFGNAATGANPTDRGKRGTKRSLPDLWGGDPSRAHRGRSESA